MRAIPKQLTPVLLSAVAIGLVAAACGAPPSATTATTSTAAAPTSITIGAPSTVEQSIVANLYADALRHAGIHVTLSTGLGGRESVEPALATDQLDLYPDYAGSLLLYLDSNDTAAATDTSTALPALRSLLGVAGVTVLNPAPALDTEVFAVTAATAAQYHLTTLSSLGPVAGQLVLGGPPGCQQDPLCLVGLQDTYGLHFKSFTSLDDAGPITVAALNGGQVQVGVLNSSDGTIVENGFVALADDKHLLLADYVVPVIRKSVDTGTVTAVLDGLSAQLTTDQLAQLNVEVNVDGDDPGAVAQRWLEHNHLI